MAYNRNKMCVVSALPLNGVLGATTAGQISALCADYDDLVVLVNIASIGTQIVEVSYNVVDVLGNPYQIASTGPLVASGQAALVVRRPLGALSQVIATLSGTGNVTMFTELHFSKDG